MELAAQLAREDWHEGRHTRSWWRGLYVMCTGLNIRHVGAGLPESALELAAQLAKEDGHEGATPDAGPWLFGLDFPSYFPVMTHAKDRCGLYYYPCKADSIFKTQILLNGCVVGRAV